MSLGFRTAALMVISLMAWSGLGIAADNRANLDTLVQDNSVFAVDLYKTICTEKGNIFFSPYSISLALSMTYAGAGGNTAEQMRRALKFSLKRDEIYSSYEILESKLKKIDAAGHVRLNSVNSLWPQKDYALLPKYLDVVSKYYRASVTPLDFKHGGEIAREKINNWVATETQEKIQDIIPPGVLDDSTRLVLANAVYFKGNWERKFESDLTQETPFFLSKDNNVQSRMMTQTGHYNYGANELLQILQLPYVGNELSMLVLLPRELDGLKSLEDQLSISSLNDWKSKMKQNEVVIFLPKFKNLSSFELKDTLVAMGMSDLFSPRNADLSGMAAFDPNNPLFLSEAIHKAFVEVGEEGTEAAAATAILGRVMGHKSDSEKKPPIFRADHPFIFLIQENVTGSIVFLGRVSEPSSEVK
jgi:serpin B